jgi:ABC-type multidrug transport system permease subunit
LERLGQISPVAWCLKGLHRLLFYGGTFVDVLAAIGVLVLFALVFLTVGTIALRSEADRSPVMIGRTNTKIGP